MDTVARVTPDPPAGRASRSSPLPEATGKRHVELQDRTSAAGENGGKLPAFPRRGDQRNRLAGLLRLPHQQPGRDGNAHPTVLQYVDGEAGAARSQCAIQAQVVIDARERSFDRQRFGLALRGIGFIVERAVLGERYDNPAG
jgi:hypothetical protein